MKQENLKTQKQSFLTKLSIVNYTLSIAIASLLTACGTTNTTTTTRYDTDGNVTETIVVESETSDLTAYINAGDGNVTSLNGDISKFKLGYADVGLSWFSISGGRQKAPVNTDSNSAEALEQISEVVKATKTSIITETLAINSDLASANADTANADTANTTETSADTDAKTENLTTSTPINNEIDVNLTNDTNDTNDTNVSNDTNDTNLSTVE